jgi:Tol biopolymer transport system component
LNLNIVAIVVAIVIIGGYLMIRRAPNAKWMILTLMVIIISSAYLMVYLNRGSSLFAKSLSDERIAYINDDGKRSDVYTMKLDGSDKQNVTNDPAIDRSPAWSSNGTEIAFVSDKVDGKFQLGVVTWNGRSNRILTVSAGTKESPEFIHKGQDILYLSSGKLMTIDHAGGEETQIFPPEESQRNAMTEFLRMTINSGSFSADGGYLLLLQETDAGQAMTAFETPEEQISKTGEMKTLEGVLARQISCQWAPVGHKFAASLVDSQGANILYVMNLDSMDRTQILRTKGDTFGAGRVVWSPDGSKLVYEYWTVMNRLLDKSQGLYIVSPDNGKPSRLVSGDAQSPCWSADGKYVFYTKSREDGKRDIWRVGADGSGAVNLTKGEGDNYSPAASPLPRSKN